MFKITNTHKHGLQLQNDAGETLTVGELINLIDLHKEIDNYLQKRGKTDYISTFRARRLATTEGYNVPTNSITSACERGNIINARKSKGRWQIPVASWEQWYSEWKERKTTQQTGATHD